MAAVVWNPNEDPWSNMACSIFMFIYKLLLFGFLFINVYSLKNIFS